MFSFIRDLSVTPFIDLPFQLISWIGWLLIAGCFFWLTITFWKQSPLRTSRSWWVFAALVLLTPATTFLFALRLPVQELITPNLPVESIQPVMVFLFALPVVLCAGMVGIAPAAILGFLAGGLTAFYVSHNLFTPLECGIAGFLIGFLVRQKYRTSIYRLLRHPLGAAIVVSLAMIPLLLITSFLSISGSLAERFDYALTQNWGHIIARMAEIIIAGSISEIVFYFIPSFWYHPKELIPSPAEESLEKRAFFVSVPMIAIVFIVLIISDWLVAGNAARQMIRDRLASSAQVAAESLPYFLETGQSLIQDFADSELVSLSQAEAADKLSANIRLVPYFNQLYLWDANQTLRAAYPESNFDLEVLQEEEQLGLDLALKGVNVQTYTLLPTRPEDTAQISIISAIIAENGEIIGVLLGKTELNTNPFTIPALNAISGIAQAGGEGYILDSEGRVLFYAGTSEEGGKSATYVGILPETTDYYEDISATGTRQLVYFQEVVGVPWSIALTMPAKAAQEIALDIAIPLMIILIIFTLIGLGIIQYSVHALTGDIGKIAEQASKISQGKLEEPILGDGVDEVGRLGTAFEQMRLSLREKLGDLNRLLSISQGISASLDLEEAIQPVLQTIIGRDVISARVILAENNLVEGDAERLVSYGDGPAAKRFAYLDEQIFDVMRTQEVLAISNLERVRRVIVTGGQRHPGALIAFALSQKNTYYGALWVGYEHPRSFSEDEVRFLTTVASETAIAADNARLYINADIGRQRLEAVLNSTPEPVMVFDDQDRLLLINPAALQVQGLIKASTTGLKVREVLNSSELSQWIMKTPEQRVFSRDINLGENRIFNVSIAPVMGEDREVGKVCVLRDITYYKQMDSIKSEFVTTVSHELRSPIALMRGHATMIQMIGDLNEQQKLYTTKLFNSLEHMTHIITNILDLSRIENGIGLKLEEFFPHVIVEQVIQGFQPQLAQKNIAISFEKNPQVEMIKMTADPAQIQQAMVNLVDNAIKYSKRNGQISIRMAKEGEFITLSVEDHGIGIAPIDLPHIFEKFYRSGRREASDQRGTGLGLAIVKTIVERHKGKVSVDSQLGKGSVFKLELPIVQSGIKSN